MTPNPGGFWRLCHDDLTAALARHDLTGEQLRVLLALADLTQGYGKAEDTVSLGQIARRAGMFLTKGDSSKPDCSHVARALRQLKELGLYGCSRRCGQRVTRWVQWPPAPSSATTAKDGNTATQGNSTTATQGSITTATPGSKTAATQGRHQEVEKGQEEERPPIVPQGHESDFDAFWKAYPRKVGKAAAQKAWKQAKDKPDLARLLAIIDTHKRSAEWKKENGRFIPHPMTWLNQGRWDDEIRAVSPDSPGGVAAVMDRL